MNTTNKVLIAGAILIGLAILFPPMRYVEDNPHYRKPNANGTFDFEREISTVSYGFIGSADGDFLVERLVFELFGIALVVGIIIFIIKQKESAQSGKQA